MAADSSEAIDNEFDSYGVIQKYAPFYRNFNKAWGRKKKSIRQTINGKTENELKKKAEEIACFSRNYLRV